MGLRKSIHSTKGNKAR